MDNTSKVKGGKDSYNHNASSDGVTRGKESWIGEAVKIRIKLV